MGSEIEEIPQKKNTEQEDEDDDLFPVNEI